MSTPIPHPSPWSVSRVRRLAMLVVLLVTPMVVSTGAEVPTGLPKEIGLSAKRLQRIDQVIERAIES